MSTLGSESTPSTENSLRTVCRPAGASKKLAWPVSTSPAGPRSGDLKVSTWVVFVLYTSLAAWIWSFRTTSTPRPFAPGSAATATALYRFIGPSALIAVAGRIDPTRTTGLSLLGTRWGKEEGFFVVVV